MQRPMARMPLALFSLAATLVLGCEDPRSDPLGPETMDRVFRASRTATVTLAGGMQTPTGQPQSVGIEKDLDWNLLLSGPIQIKLNLSNTIAAGTGSCEISGARTDDATKQELLNRFADDFQVRDFAVHVDKTALGQVSDHNIVLHWVDDRDFREFRGGLGPGVTVTATVNADGSMTYTFTGGVAGIRDESGKPNENVTLHCPNLDTVEVTVVK